MNEDNALIMEAYVKKAVPPQFEGNALIPVTSPACAKIRQVLI